MNVFCISSATFEPLHKLFTHRLQIVVVLPDNNYGSIPDDGYRLTQNIIVQNIQIAIIYKLRIHTFSSTALGKLFVECISLWRLFSARCLAQNRNLRKMRQSYIVCLPINLSNSMRTHMDPCRVYELIDTNIDT